MESILKNRQLFIMNYRNRVSDMAQGVQALANKPEDPIAIPRTHMVEGEKQFPCSLLTC